MRFWTYTCCSQVQDLRTALADEKDVAPRALQPHWADVKNLTHALLNEARPVPSDNRLHAAVRSCRPRPRLSCTPDPCPHSGGTLLRAARKAVCCNKGCRQHGAGPQKRAPARQTRPRRQLAQLPFIRKTSFWVTGCKSEAQGGQTGRGAREPTQRAYPLAPRNALESLVILAGSS